MTGVGVVGIRLSMIPKASELIEALRIERDTLSELGLHGHQDIEVRLHILNGWELLVGDPQYDTDHRGAWGYAYICGRTTIGDLTVTARQLREEVRDQIHDLLDYEGLHNDCDNHETCGGR